MTIEWSDVLGFVAGAGLASLGLALVKAYRKFVSLTVNIKEFEELATAIRSNANRLDVIVDMYDKASTDNDKAANSIAKSAVQMQEMLTEIKTIMMPPAQADAQPQSFMTLQTSFENIEKELLTQGLDPETAKYKAAEYELDRLAEGDLSEISMSL